MQNVGVIPADDVLNAMLLTARVPHACKFALSKCQHAPAAFAPRASLRRDLTGALQKHGVAYAATKACVYRRVEHAF